MTTMGYGSGGAYGGGASWGHQPELHAPSFWRPEATNPYVQQRLALAAQHQQQQAELAAAQHLHDAQHLQHRLQLQGLPHQQPPSFHHQLPYDKFATHQHQMMAAQQSMLGALPFAERGAFPDHGLDPSRATQAEVLSQISGGVAAAHLVQGQLPFNGQGYHGLLPTAAGSLMPLSAEAQAVDPLPTAAQPQHAPAARSPPSEPMDAEPVASSSSLAPEPALALTAEPMTLAAQCAELSKQLALQKPSSQMQKPSSQMLTSVIGASGMNELFSGVTDDELQRIIGDIPEPPATAA